MLLRVPGAPDGKAASGPATPVSTVPFGPKAPPLSSSTSTTKQFIVYGGDLELRSVFCQLCEETAASLSRVLKDDGKFVLPVRVVLYTPPDIRPDGAAVTPNIGELVHGGFHLQLDAQLRTGFRTQDFTRELVKVLLAERILRNHKKLSSTRQSGVLPAWVMTGAEQALNFKSRSRPSALFSAVFKGGRVYTLDHILSADPEQLDALSRGIYETSTCALVLTLLDQPEGPVRFLKFLNALAVENKSDRELLTQYFPNLATSKSALEKWWSLQMAALATPSAMETIGVAETEDELDSALMLVIPGSKKQEESTSPATAAAAAPTEEPAEKKRGIFGWMKRDSKEEPKPEETPEPKAAPEEKKTSTQEVEEVAPAPTSDGAAESEPPKPETEGELEMPFLRVPSLLNPFGESRKIIFGFKKKTNPDTEAAESDKTSEGKKTETKKSDAKTEPKKTETAKPETKKTETAKTETAKPAKTDDSAASKSKKEEPAPSLTGKPGQTRSIGSKPEGLPKTPPTTADKIEKPAAPAKTDKPATADANANKTAEAKPEEAKPDKPNNFRNWFRKKPDTEEKTAEAAALPEKPAAKPEVKSEPPKVVAKPKSSPAPATRATRPGTIPLEDFALIAKRGDRIDILNRCLNNLNALKLRAHFLYKPLVADYTTVVESIIAGKSKGMATKLEDLRRQREAIHERAVAIESHLDFYEANNTGTLSHAFDDFLKLSDELEHERLPRGDALSKDLDAAQQLAK